MKSIVKKGIICSMLGIMQLGMGASVIEASPLHTEYSMQQLDRDSHYNHERHEREHYRHERERIERERHERAMRRRERENEREWHERQRHERERHEENQRRIAHDILNLILDN